MACKLYVRTDNFETYLGRFKNQEKAAAHFQLIRAKMETEYGTDIKSIYVEQGKRRITFCVTLKT